MSDAKNIVVGNSRRAGELRLWCICCTWVHFRPHGATIEQLQQESQHDCAQFPLPPEQPD
jgi:hypothetical protein